MKITLTDKQAHLLLSICDNWWSGYDSINMEATVPGFNREEYLNAINALMAQVQKVR